MKTYTALILAMPILISSPTFAAPTAADIAKRLTHVRTVTFVHEDWLGWADLSAVPQLKSAAESICFIHNTRDPVPWQYDPPTPLTVLEKQCSDELLKAFRAEYEILREKGAQYDEKKDAISTAQLEITACRRITGASSDTDTASAMDEVFHRCAVVAGKYANSLRSSHKSYQSARAAKQKLAAYEASLNELGSELRKAVEMNSQLNSRIGQLIAEVDSLKKSKASSGSSGSTGQAGSQSAQGCVQKKGYTGKQLTVTNSCPRAVEIELVRQCFALSGFETSRSYEVVLGSRTQVIDLEVKFGSFCSSIAANRTDDIGAQVYK